MLSLRNFWDQYFPFIFFFPNGHRNYWIAKAEWDRKLNSVHGPNLERTDIRLCKFWSLKNCLCALVDTNLHKTCGRKYIKERTYILIKVYYLKPPYTAKQTGVSTEEQHHSRWNKSRLNCTLSQALPCKHIFRAAGLQTILLTGLLVSACDPCSSQNQCLCCATNMQDKVKQQNWAIRLFNASLGFMFIVMK